MLKRIALCCAVLLLSTSCRFEDKPQTKPFQWVADSTVNLIVRFEGKSNKAYQDSQGNWTIGIGHLIRTQEAYMLDRELSDHEVRGILHQDLNKCTTALKTALRVTVTPEQRDAMLSLCHNIGPDNMVRSEVVHYLNQNKTELAANAFLNWSNPPDLKRRREYERKLFLRNI